MMQILFLFFIYFSTLSLVFITKRRFGECVSFSFIINTLLVFISGFFNDLRIGLILSLLLPLSSFILFLKNRKNLKEYIKLFFSSGFFIFTAFYILVLIFHHYTTLNNFDEFAHWGVMIKETYRLNKFYCIDESNLIVHKDYPPFFTLLEYLFLKLTRSYNESSIYKIVSIFTLSLFLPIIEKNKNIISKILIIFFSLALNHIAFDDLYTSNIINAIYVDFPLAILGAFACFYAYEYAKEKNNISFIFLSLSLIALMLTKQIAIAFLGMSLLVYFFTLLFNKEGIETSFIIKSILSFVLPFIALKAYSIYANQFDISAQFSLAEQFSLSNFFNIIFKGTGEKWQLITYKNFNHDIIYRPLILGLPLSYYPLNVLIGIMLFISIYLYQKDIKKSLIYSLIYLFGSLAYALTMLMLYTMSFGPIDGPELMCFSRYLNTYILFGFAILIFIISLTFNNKISQFIIPIILIIFSIYSATYTFDYLKPKTKLVYEYEEYPNAKKAIEKIDRVAKGGRLIIIQSNVYEGQSLGTLLNYYYDNFRVISIVNNRISDFSAYLESDLSLNDFKELLEEYDYIYIENYDDYFYDNFWLPITDTYLEEERLYYIDPNNIPVWAG